MQLYKFECGCIGLGPDEPKTYDEFLVLNPCNAHVNIFTFIRAYSIYERMNAAEKQQWMKDFRKDATADALGKLQKIRKIVL